MHGDNDGGGRGFVKPQKSFYTSGMDFYTQGRNAAFQSMGLLKQASPDNTPRGLQTAVGAARGASLGTMPGLLTSIFAESPKAQGLGALLALAGGVGGGVIGGVRGYQKYDDSTLADMRRWMANHAP